MDTAIRLDSERAAAYRVLAKVMGIWPAGKVIEYMKAIRLFDHLGPGTRENLATKMQIEESRLKEQAEKVRSVTLLNINQAPVAQLYT